jgi:hypothetical protein
VLSAICIRCGASKEAPYARCNACGFEPRDDSDLVKSVYLSAGRFDPSKSPESYQAELQTLANTLSSGGAVEYTPSELIRLESQLRSFRAVPTRTVWGAVGRLFLPAAIVLAALAALVFALRLRGE